MDWLVALSQWDQDYDAAVMTYHTSGPGHVSDYLHEEPWLDFTSVRSCHSDLVESWRFIEKHWKRQPIKPVIDLESSYPGALILAAHRRAMRGRDYAFIYSPGGAPFTIRLGVMAGRSIKAASLCRMQRRSRRMGFTVVATSGRAGRIARQPALGHGASWRTARVWMASAARSRCARRNCTAHCASIRRTSVSSFMNQLPSKLSCQHPTNHTP